MLLTVIIFLLILGLLVYVHEAGHFTTARRNGITCHEFGFGFPPRMGGVYKDLETGKWKLVLGNKEYYGDSTLYSMNWIPLGGFVRIKGEDGNTTDPDSFAAKSAWIRFKVLFAGVFMNFILAWILISIVLMIGAPEPYSDQIDPARIVGTPSVQVISVDDASPAEKMGISVGDSIRQVCGTECVTIITETDLQDATMRFASQDISVDLERGKEMLTVNGKLRGQNAEGGVLGIAMSQTAIVQYAWYEAIYMSFIRVGVLIVAILAAFGSMIWGGILSLLALVGIIGKDMVHSVSGDVAGPIGIAKMTGQMKDLGIAYLLQFSAILSVNLGIINALPIPALDGGRILFLIIEKVKGAPVNQRTESIIHGISFTLLILLMIFVTVKDILKLI